MNTMNTRTNVSFRAYMDILNETTGLDSIFLRRAIEVTSFNLKEIDFKSLQYKEEIRFLFTDAWFPGLDTKKVFTTKTDAKSLQKSIDVLKSSNLSGFNKLFSYKAGAVGPGELMLFFICDKGHLGGGNSAGVDLVVNGTNFEVKAVLPKKSQSLGFQVLSDFKLGGTVNLSPVITKLSELLKSKELIKQTAKNTEMKGSLIDQVRSTDEFKEIEHEYAKLAKEYFGKHDIIFLNNAKAVKNRGDVLSLSNVDIGDIFIERVTSGTVKPLIKV